MSAGMGLILSALVGGVIGFLAGLLLRKKGFGHLLNFFLGLVGGFTGGSFFYLITLIKYDISYQLLFALLGAVFLLWTVFLIKRKG